MRISFTKRGGSLTAHLDGELDQHCASALRGAIDAKVKEDAKIKSLILELGKVGFMDSSGIGVILGRYKLMRDLGGEILITNAQPAVEKLLRLSGVYALIDSTRRGRANE